MVPWRSREDLHTILEKLHSNPRTSPKRHRKAGDPWNNYRRSPEDLIRSLWKIIEVSQKIPWKLPAKIQKIPKRSPEKIPRRSPDAPMKKNQKSSSTRLVKPLEICSRSLEKSQKSHRRSQKSPSNGSLEDHQKVPWKAYEKPQKIVRRDPRGSLNSFNNYYKIPSRAPHNPRRFSEKKPWIAAEDP